MVQEVRADYTDLARLAQDILEAADGVTNALRTARDAFTLPVSAFGNSSVGSSVHYAHEQTTETGGVTVERLVEVLEGDVDRVYRVAFAYRKADLEAAEDTCRNAPRGGPQPC
ncbi:MAG: hypothetical protein GEU94_07085 [Micromonosporaceae bacterium]|nr:hypothetical protein [Micromonosporaceae bacterium]